MLGDPTPRAELRGPSPLVRASAVIVVVLAGLAFAACTSSNARRSCGPPPYTVTVDGKQLAEISSCAGNLPAIPVPISVKLGDTIAVMTPQASGYPLPVPADSHVVDLIGKTPTMASYNAVALGTTPLVVTTSFCPPLETTGRPTCSVIVVTVRS